MLSPNALISGDLAVYAQTLVHSVLVEFSNLAEARVRWCPEFVAVSSDSFVQSLLDSYEADVHSSSSLLDFFFK